MSDIAVSQETFSNSPNSFLRRGCRTRSGSLTISVKAMPLGQAKPLDNGFCLSGRSDSSFPSSTVAIIPQSGSQIRQ